MRDVLIVSQEEFDLAIKMEEKIATLPKDSGVLFVSVSVERNIYYSTFKVVVGCARDMEEDGVCALVRNLLREELWGKMSAVEAYRGRSVAK